MRDIGLYKHQLSILERVEKAPASLTGKDLAGCVSDPTLSAPSIPKPDKK